MATKLNLNKTHSAEFKSWLSSANTSSTDFPIQNLPLGMYRESKNAELLPGIAIGDSILCLEALLCERLVEGDALVAAKLAHGSSLNELMGADVKLASALRHVVFDMLSTGSSIEARVRQCLIKQDDVLLELPVQVGDFSDFSVSRSHNSTLGKVAKREAALHPNFEYLPIAYHGRCSSLVASGMDVRRPLGQRGLRTDTQPTNGASRRLDYELELGLYMGLGSEIGQPVNLNQAEKHLFGMCLLNDWSARDIQSWELTPLGPFQGKSFMTTLSPWVVTLEALAPFRCATTPWPDTSPARFDYFEDAAVAATGGFDIRVEAAIQSQAMREKGLPHFTVSRGRLADHPWNVFQLITHQTRNGCNLRPGDLIGTGTISGSGPGEQGCLQEVSLGGSVEFSLPSGEKRTYLEDGDEVAFSASCSRDGFVRIGFGQCKGTVKPALLS
jgi:fumarylacetoacetase